jgi:hypothetical protein
VSEEERESKAVRTSLFGADCATLSWKLPAAWLATQTKTKPNDQTIISHTSLKGILSQE